MHFLFRGVVHAQHGQARIEQRWVEAAQLGEVEAVSLAVVQAEQEPTDHAALAAVALGDRQQAFQRGEAGYLVLLLPGLEVVDQLQIVVGRGCMVSLLWGCSSGVAAPVRLGKSST